MLTTTKHWDLHLLPFEKFIQEANPNRESTGLDLSDIEYLGFQIRKESVLELWLDNIAIYRRKGSDASGDD